MSKFQQTAASSPEPTTATIALAGTAAMPAIVLAKLERERGPQLVVVGLARGGVEVAAEIARALAAPLDVVAVRKIGHPWQPEYGIGAITPGDGVYVRAPDGLTDEQLAAVIEETKANHDLPLTTDETTASGYRMRRF